MKKAKAHRRRASEQPEQARRASRKLPGARTARHFEPVHNDLFKACFDTASQAIIVCEDNGVIVAANKATQDIFGYSQHEIIGQPVEHLIPPEYRERHAENFARYLENPVSRPMGIGLDLLGYHKTGRRFPAEIGLNLMKSPNGTKLAIAYISDISRRKQAEEALRQSENQYHELFNSVLEGIGIVDENEIIKFCNPALARIFEVNSPDELIGKKLPAYLADDQEQHFFDETAKRRMKQSSQYELEIVTALGNRRTIHLSVSPRFDQQNCYIGAFGAIMDITETKRLQEAASRAQRLDTAGMVAGQVAHDFNNLLGPLVAYPDFIKNELPDGHPAIPLVNAIVQTAEQMAELNQQLLTLGRRAQFRQEPLNLNEIIEHVINQARPMPDSIKIKTELCRNLMMIKGGPSQIQRALTNLINNARDAIHDGGEISIKTRNFTLDAMAGNYGQVPRGEYVKLIVSDTGCGIPGEILPKIFDPFFTTKTTDKKRGSGLGLSIVHAVVEDHKGYIDVQSEVGKGTAFYVYFPPCREGETAGSS